MKTSLICLLLLAAVACAAPQAGEMPGEKRAGMAEKMKEKMAEKRKEIAKQMRERAEENGEEMVEKRKEMAEKRKEMAKKMHERTEEKREQSENAVAAVKSDGEAESRFYPPCFGICSGYGGVGCYYDECYSYYDIIFYDYLTGCVCCRDAYAPQSCYYY